MKLSEIYNQLAYGELRQIVMGTGPMPVGEVGIPQAKQAEIFPFVVLGLTELHKRFKIREGSTSVTLIDSQADYSLASVTDLMQVEHIYGTADDKPYDIPLNENLDWAIRTPVFNQLVVPTDSNKAPWLLETPALTVTYRADHPVIDSNIANAAAQIVDIELPSVYLQALLYYVCARLTASLGATSEGYHEGDNYQAKFEYACQVLKADSFEVDEEVGFDKLRLRGWV